MSSQHRPGKTDQPRTPVRCIIEPRSLMPHRFRNLPVVGSTASCTACSQHRLVAAARRRAARPNALAGCMGTATMLAGPDLGWDVAVTASVWSSCTSYGSGGRAAAGSDALAVVPDAPADARSQDPQRQLRRSNAPTPIAVTPAESAGVAKIRRTMAVPVDADGVLPSHLSHRWRGGPVPRPRLAHVRSDRLPTRSPVWPDWGSVNPYDFVRSAPPVTPARPSPWSTGSCRR